MNLITKTTFLITLFLLIGFGCTPKDNSSTTTPPKEETSNTDMDAKSEPEEVNPYLIGKKSFMGLTPGNLIADHSDVLEKSVLKTGEGDFEVFNIKDESGEVLGNILPDPRDESKIGIITITSTKASTSEGAKIGITFKELEEVLGELPVHGSEIESRTSAFKGNWSFLLDAAFPSYEIDKNELDVNVRIKVIDIRPNAYAK